MIELNKVGKDMEQVFLDAEFFGGRGYFILFLFCFLILCKVYVYYVISILLVPWKFYCNPRGQGMFVTGEPGRSALLLQV